VTPETYAGYMARARGEAFRRLASYDRQVAKIYLDLAAQVNEELAKAPTDFAKWHLKQVVGNLSKAAADAQSGYETLIEKALREAAGIQTDAFRKGTAEYLEVLDKRLGITVDTAKLIGRIPTEAVQILYARTYEDGLYLSDRIWKMGELSRSGISRIVTEGMARGLHYDDPRIAEQLKRFLQPARQGKKLSPTITRTLKEIDPKTGKHLTFTFRQRPVSFDAARLLRNEYMESFKQAQHLSAERNPACYGEEWELSSEHPDIMCECPDYAEHDEGLGIGVYPVGDIPMTPHCGCLCVTSSVVVEMAVFNDWIDEYMQTGGGRIGDWWSRNELEMAA